MTWKLTTTDFFSSARSEAYADRALLYSAGTLHAHAQRMTKNTNSSNSQISRFDNHTLDELLAVVPL